MVQGLEFQSIIKNIFGEVRGFGISSQIQCNCPRCATEYGKYQPDNKFNLEISTASGKLYYKCWRCDSPKFSGPLGKLIKNYGSHADYTLYQSYAGSYTSQNINDEIEYEPVVLPEEMILFSEMNVNDWQHLEAYNYLILDRKISRDFILKYRLGFCISGKYKNRIIIPSYDEFGNINYFVGRSWDKKSKQKYMNPDANKDIIFNDGYINWDSLVTLLEGGFDMFSAPNSIPLLGKTLLPKLFMKLKEIKPNIIVLLDPDAYKSSIELYHTLHSIYVDCEERVKIVKLPNNDDIDEIKRKYGFDEVIKNLYLARGLVIDDYFIQKLQKPYAKRTGRYDSYSKYFSR